MDKITIGSDLSCTVCVNKSTIAAKHCTIETDEKGHFTVTNLEPNFETWVNGEKIENKSSFENIFNVRVGDVTLQWSEIKQDYEYDKNIKAYGIKERHWFVSFWLWLGIIANIITIPFSISEIGQSGLKSGLIGTILIIVFVSIIIICYFKLLHWKKKGFWGLVCTSIFLVVSSIIIIISQGSKLGLTIGSEIISIVMSTIVPILILWAVLQIRKDGISCWKQLE